VPGKGHVFRASAAELLRMKWINVENKDSTRVMKGIAENLRTYHQLEQFDRLILSLVADHADCTRAQHLRRTFRQMDTESTGLLTKDNLLEGLKSVHEDQDHNPMEEEEIEQLFKKLDRETTGEIHYHEWMAVTVGKHMLQQEDVIRKAFDYLDFSNNGSICKEDLVHAIGEEETNRLMDQNKGWFGFGQATLKFDDFKKVVNEIAEKRTIILTQDVIAPPTSETTKRPKSKWAESSLGAPEFRAPKHEDHLTAAA